LAALGGRTGKRTHSSIPVTDAIIEAGKVSKKHFESDYEDGDDSVYEMLGSRYAKVMRAGGQGISRHKNRHDDDGSHARRDQHQKHKRVRVEPI